MRFKDKVDSFQGPVLVVLTHTWGSFFSRLWCRGKQDAREDRTYRKMFICGTQHSHVTVHGRPEKIHHRRPSHRHRHGHRARQAPDQGVVQGQPAEVRVPVALRVQSHRQTWKPAARLRGYTTDTVA